MDEQIISRISSLEQIIFKAIMTHYIFFLLECTLYKYDQTSVNSEPCLRGDKKKLFTHVFI